MLSHEQVVEQVRAVLKETFELPDEKVVLEAHLVNDLDLDSFDAIDLAVRLEIETGLKLEESELRSIRTVRDIVDTICSNMGIEPVAQEDR